MCTERSGWKWTEWMKKGILALVFLLCLWRAEGNVLAANAQNEKTAETESVEDAEDNVEMGNEESEKAVGSWNKEESEKAVETENGEEAWKGAQLEKSVGSYMEELDFSDIDKMLEEQEVTEEIDFKELVERMLAGEEIGKGWLFQQILSAVFSEIRAFRGTMVQMVILCIVFAILYNFANVFENPAVTEISFYMVYVLLLVLLMKSFFILRDVSVTAIGRVMMFLKAVIPTFTASMVFSGQITTAAGFYDLTFLLIYVMEWIMQHLMIPGIQIYVVLELMNYLTEEEMLSRMTSLIKSGILWGVKFIFTVVIGINVVQNLLTPVIDTFKSGLIAKTAGMMPGLGTSINAVTEIMVGSGIIIKNGIGMAAIVVLLILCAGPLIKVWVMTFLYKLLAAMIQPAADKRMIGCIAGTGEGGSLLSKVVVTTTVMFLVTIAMVTAATTFNH